MTTQMSLSNEPVKPRVADRYVPTYWKCVNWHNLLTQEGPLAGDVYNLGRIQSGKTTWLDGGHATFTGGDDFMAWNSAADPTSTAKSNPEGRRLKDIVCRVNDDGVQHPDGNISYFALELTNHHKGHVVTICLGAQARSIKSQIERWGLLIDRPLREIQFEDANGEVKGKEWLAEDYGAGHVHAKIGAYRRRVAEFFFGNLQNLERVEQFLDMGKSYTKLLKEGHDVGQLVRSVLPDPSPEEFDKTRAQIKEIRTLDATIGGLDGLRRKLLDVQAETRKITRARDRILRYDYAEKLHALTKLNGEMGALQASIGITSENLAKARALETQTAERHARARDALDILSREVDSELLAKAAELKSQLLAQGNRVTALTRAEEEESKKASRLDAEHGGTKAETKGAIAEFSEMVQRQVASAAGDLQAAGTRLRRTLDGIAPLETLDLSPFEAALREWNRSGDKLGLDLAKEREDLEKRVAEFVEAEDKLRRELLDLEAKKDIPPVEGLDAAIRGLEDKVLVAYRTMEPRLEADTFLLEQFLGPHVLGAIIPLDAQSTEAVRRAVHAVCPGVKVVDRKEVGNLATIPQGSILQALDPQKTNALTLAYLAHEFSDVQLYAPGTPRGKASRVVWRDGHVYDGIAWQLAKTQGELDFIGQAARKRLDAQKARVRNLLQATIEQREAEQRRIALKNSEQTALVTMLEAVGAGLARLSLNRRVHAIQNAAAKAAAQAEKAAGALRDLHEARSRLDEIRRDLERLEARLRATKMEEKNRLLQEAIQEEASLRGLHHDQGVARGKLEGTLESADAQLTGLQGKMPAARADEQSALLALLPVAKRAGYNPADIALYVESEHIRGISPTTLKDNRKAAEGEEREAIARIGALLSEAGKWRVLRHDKDANLILETSTGHELDRVVAEISEGINEKVRDKTSRLEELTSKQIIHTLVADMKSSRDHMMRLIKRVNEVLTRTPFQGSIYTIKPSKRKDDPDILRLSNLVEEFSAENQRELASFIQTHLVGVEVEPGKVPEKFDYRNWYAFQVTRERAGQESDMQQFARKASGGGKALPHYLLCFGLFNVLYNTIQAKARIVFIDEAFRNMDAETIDDLIGFAKEMELDLVVAAPELGGRTSRMEDATVQMFTKDDATQETHIRPFLQETPRT